MGAGRKLATILLFLALSAFDIGLNAAAGAAAVAAGAHVNGSTLTDYALGVGAVAGVTKAGLLAFVGFLGFANLNIAAYLLLIIVSSIFGIAVLITAEVSNTVLGTTPSELLIAGVVAALPLQFEGVGMYYSMDSYIEYNNFDGPRIIYNPGNTVSGLIALTGWDALGGYTFARMAQNQGMPICELKSAAAAGAVFGVLAGIPKFVAYTVWGLVHFYESD